MKTNVLFVSLFWISISTYGQSNISGKILDKETHLPVPYANITIDDKNGTATNEYGFFLIQLSGEIVRGKRATLSSIGYASATISLDSVNTLRQHELILFLTPSVTTLSEVIVSETRQSPETLVHEAMNQIAKNYSQQPFNMEFYARIVVRDTIRDYYVVESIVDTYRKGYIEGAENHSKMLQRRETGVNPLPMLFDKKRKINYFPYETLPLFNIFLVDIIGSGKKYNYTVFNPDYQSNLNFHWKPSTTFEGDSVSVISYEPNGTKSRSEKDKRDGVLFISEKSQAIVKHHRVIGAISFDVSYRKWGAHYFPYFIRSVYPISEKGKLYQVVLELYIKKVIDSNVTIYEDGANGRDWHLSDVPFDSKYWEVNYPLK